MGDTIYLSITPGEMVSYLGENYYIKQIPDLSTVLIEHPVTKQILRSEIKQLTFKKEEGPKTEARDITGIPDKDWHEAERRFAIILPILQNRQNKDILKWVSKEMHVSVPTLYRWVSKYEQTGNKSSLAPSENHGGRGKGRIPEEL